MNLRDHTYIGMTQSLCPDCRRVVPAKIIVRNNRVYFRKRCPEHGVREDFICSDARQFDRHEYATPGKLPRVFGTEPKHGCPLDCGLCTDHEQHTCIALLEITSNCNLTCPMCFAGSAPGGTHLTKHQCLAAIDRLVEVEGRPEVLQLSGGEPTIHPDFIDILQYSCDQPIDVVMINTNGIRFANDEAFVADVAKFKHRAEVYFQLDGFDESNHRELRGASLLKTKLRALDALQASGLNVTLVCTLQTDVNEDQVGDIIRLGLSTPNVTGVSFQPATYSGRYFLPDELERRITFPDVVKAIADQAGELFQESDFLPLPCAHPNGHTLSYAFRGSNDAIPLNRFIDIENNMDLLANGIVFTRDRAKSLIDRYLSRTSCGGQSDDCGSAHSTSVLDENHRDERTIQLAGEFLTKSASKTLRQSDLLRVTVTSFMDAYNFDVRQVMKSCVHHLLPSGHLIPFSAYNVLYRDGHVSLPELSNVEMRCETSDLPVVSLSQPDA